MLGARLRPAGAADAAYASVAPRRRERGPARSKSGRTLSHPRSCRTEWRSSDIAALYARKVERLAAALSRSENRSEVTKVLAELVEEVVVYPSTDASPVEIEVAAHARRLIA